jgi:hypothetical protein
MIFFSLQTFVAKGQHPNFSMPILSSDQLCFVLPFAAWHFAYLQELLIRKSLRLKSSASLVDSFLGPNQSMDCWLAISSIRYLFIMDGLELALIDRQCLPVKAG